jgi:hypothetical protein
MNRDPMPEIIANVRVAMPIHKKMTGRASFNFSKIKKNAIKEMPVIKKAIGHENLGSRSWSLIVG